MPRLYFIDKNGRLLGESNISLTSVHRYIRRGKYIDAIAQLNKEIIGGEISIHEDYPVVTRVCYPGPAKEAGIEEGDKIVKINDRSTKGWDVNKVLQNLMGPKGTQVTLTIERKVKNKGKNFEKTITRRAPLFSARSLIYAVM